VEQRVPGVSGLSFVDDIGRWAEGKDDEAMAAKLSEAAMAMSPGQSKMVWPSTTGRQKWRSSGVSGGRGLGQGQGEGGGQ